MTAGTTDRRRTVAFPAMVGAVGLVTRDATILDVEEVGDGRAA
jgi:hypothetical protein